MALTIGLTGGIATGKSTVSAMFQQLNIPVIDADIISREVVKPGRDAYQKIIQTFGQSILQDDQTINRKKLGNIIFSNDSERQKLNQIVHPAVRKEMLNQRQDYIDSEAEIIVMDIPLLFESELTHLVNQVLVVYVSEEKQLSRLLQRDHITLTEAEKRIRSQMPISDKVKKADVIIDNNGSIEQTKKQLLKLLKTWQI